MSRIIHNPLPRLDQAMRDRNKSQDFGYYIGERLFNGLDDDIVQSHTASYDLGTNRLVIRGPNYRVAYQGLDNRDSSHKERVLDILTKEKPSQVFISMSPFYMPDAETSIFRKPEEIDFAMQSRFQGQSNFRVG